jgi:hypothetical protein
MPLLEKTGGIPISALYRATRLGSKSAPQISHAVALVLAPTKRSLSTNLVNGLRRSGKIDNILNLAKAKPLSFNNLRRILSPIGDFIETKGFKQFNQFNKADIFNNVSPNLEKLINANLTSTNHSSLSKNIKNIVDSSKPGVTNIPNPLNIKRHGMSMGSEKPTTALRSYLKTNNISSNLVSRKQLEDILDEIDSKIITT